MQLPGLPANIFENLLQTNVLWCLGMFAILATIKLLRLRNFRTIYQVTWLSYCLLLPAIFSPYLFARLNESDYPRLLAAPAQEVASRLAVVSQQMTGSTVIAALLVTVVLASLLYFLISLLNLHRQRRGFIPCENPEVQKLLAEVASELDFRKKVACLISPLGDSPYSMGVLSPAIVLPAKMLTIISRRELRPVLAHELMHIHHHDYIKNILQKFVRALVFFNPIVILFDRYIDSVRELACDRAVLSLHSVRRGDYAQAILKLNLVATDKLTNSAVIPFSQSKSNLRRRIMQMKLSNSQDTLAQNILVAAALAVFVVILSCSRDNPVVPEKELVERTQSKEQLARLHLALSADAMKQLSPELQRELNTFTFDQNGQRIHEILDENGMAHLIAEPGARGEASFSFREQQDGEKTLHPAGPESGDKVFFYRDGTGSASRDISLEFVGELREMEKRAHEILNGVEKRHVKRAELYRDNEQAAENSGSVRKPAVKKKPGN